jgi:hypothetical protein
MMPRLTATSIPSTYAGTSDPHASHGSVKRCGARVAGGSSLSSENLKLPHRFWRLVRRKLHATQCVLGCIPAPTDLKLGHLAQGGVMAPRRWQDWTNGGLGLWMLASPSILGFAAAESPAARVAWILGLAIIVVGGIALYTPKAWEEALNIILATYLLASPWRLGYSDETVPATNAMVVGLLATVLAVWAMLMDTAVQKWWHERHLTR